MIDFEKLFLAVCKGDNETLKDYVSKGGDVNRRFSKFGRVASLLAAAYRCNCQKTVKYLLDIGASLTEEEKKTIKL